jgi:hypothetical protein
MSDTTFDLNLFIKQSKDVLVNPKTYFSNMKTSGGMTDPVIKAVIYGVVAGAFSFIWSLLHFGVLGGSIFGGVFGIMILIWKVVGALIGLIIGSVILLVISSICKGNTDFEANMRVTATVMVLMPVSSFFGFAGHINIYLGVIINLAISIIALWLMYNGLVEALKTNPETTKIVSYVLIVITVLVMIFSMGRLSRTYRMMKEFNNKDAQVIVENFRL